MLYSGDHNHCDWGVKREKRGYIQVITTIVVGVSKGKKGGDIQVITTIVIGCQGGKTVVRLV